jgi:alcohol dehydrogenase class IV
MQFEFATAGRIVFGAGVRRQLSDIANSLGKRPLVVTGKTRERAEWALRSLDGSTLFSAAGEPTVELVRTGVALCRASGCDVAIGVGGGSAIDTAKAIAALSTNEGDPLDYLEVIGKAQAISAAPLPVIAVPTTAGTGSEVTRNSVLGSPEHRVKVSLRSPLMLPRVAIVDPELTLELPRAVTAATGLDAITQLIEPYVSLRANPVTDGLCLEGLRLASRALATACDKGTDLRARTDMCAASLLGGLALANAGLGVVHGFAGAIGGMYKAAHGALCAAVLPYGITANINALRSQDPDGAALGRYATLARLVTGNSGAGPDRLADWAKALVRKLAIPTLSAYGVKPADFAGIAEKAANSNSMKTNPVSLTAAELTRVLESCL